MSRPPTVFDTDPGIDDALALAYLVASDAFDLRAITVVAGNVDLPQGTTNARGLATLYGIAADVPVHAGCPKPLLRDLSPATGIHGEDGVGGATLPEPTVPVHDDHAVAALDALSHAHAGDLVVIAVGPLTNVAAALALDPTFAARVGRLVVMGGAFAVSGNIPPAKAAEANIHNDPEAARIVADSGIPLTMVGLDVTHQTLLTAERVEALPDGPPPLRALRDALGHYIGRYRESQGLDGCPLHDPMAVAVAADPSWVEVAEGHVHVQTGDDVLAGETTLLPADGADGPPARVATTVRDGFVDHVVDALRARWG